MIAATQNNHIVALLKKHVRCNNLKQSTLTCASSGTWLVPDAIKPVRSCTQPGTSRAIL